MTRIAAQNLAAEAKSWQRKTFADRLEFIGLGVGYYHPDIFLAQETGGPLLYVPRLDHELKRHGLLRAPKGGHWRHIYFNPDTIRLYRSGSIYLGTPGKWAAWAKVVDLKTGHPLFVSSVHLSQGGEEKAQRRYREAEKLLRSTKALNTAHYPEVHGGDFNSHRLVGKVVFEPRGYVDALDVAPRGMVRHKGYNTFNGRTTVKPDPSTQLVNGDHDDHIYVSRSLSKRVTYWSQHPSVLPADHNIIAATVRP